MSVLATTEPHTEAETSHQKCSEEEDLKTDKNWSDIYSVSTSKRLEILFTQRIIPEFRQLALKFQLPVELIKAICHHKIYVLRDWKYNPEPDKLRLTKLDLNNLIAITELLMEWKRRVILHGLQMTNEALKLKADYLRKTFNARHFKISHNWLLKFEQLFNSKKFHCYTNESSLEFDRILKDIKGMFDASTYQRLLNCLKRIKYLRSGHQPHQYIHEIDDEYDHSNSEPTLINAYISAKSEEDSTPTNFENFIVKQQTDEEPDIMQEIKIEKIDESFDNRIVSDDHPNDNEDNFVKANKSFDKMLLKSKTSPSTRIRSSLPMVMVPTSVEMNDLNNSNDPRLVLGDINGYIITEVAEASELHNSNEENNTILEEGAMQDVKNNKVLRGNKIHISFSNNNSNNINSNNNRERKYPIDNNCDGGDTYCNYEIVLDNTLVYETLQTELDAIELSAIGGNYIANTKSGHDTATRNDPDAEADAFSESIAVPEIICSATQYNSIKMQAGYEPENATTALLQLSSPSTLPPQALQTLTATSSSTTAQPASSPLLPPSPPPPSPPPPPPPAPPTSAPPQPSQSISMVSSVIDNATKVPRKPKRKPRTRNPVTPLRTDQVRINYPPVKRHYNDNDKHNFCTDEDNDNDNFGRFEENDNHEANDDIIPQRIPNSKSKVKKTYPKKPYVFKPKKSRYDNDMAIPQDQGVVTVSKRNCQIGRAKRRRNVTDNTVDIEADDSDMRITDENLVFDDSSTKLIYDSSNDVEDVERGMIDIAAQKAQLESLGLIRTIRHNVKIFSMGSGVLKMQKIKKSPYNKNVTNNVKKQNKAESNDYLIDNSTINDEVAVMDGMDDIVEMLSENPDESLTQLANNGNNIENGTVVALQIDSTYDDDGDHDHSHNYDGGNEYGHDYNEQSEEAEYATSELAEESIAQYENVDGGGNSDIYSDRTSPTNLSHCEYEALEYYSDNGDDLDEARETNLQHLFNEQIEESNDYDEFGYDGFEEVSDDNDEQQRYNDNEEIFGNDPDIVNYGQRHGRLTYNDKDNNNDNDYDYNNYNDIHDDDNNNSYADDDGNASIDNYFEDGDNSSKDIKVTSTLDEIDSDGNTMITEALDDIEMTSVGLSIRGRERRHDLNSVFDQAVSLECTDDYEEIMSYCDTHIDKFLTSHCQSVEPIQLFKNGSSIISASGLVSHKSANKQLSIRKQKETKKARQTLANIGKKQQRQQRQQPRQDGQEQEQEHELKLVRDIKTTEQGTEDSEAAGKAVVQAPVPQKPKRRKRTKLEPQLRTDKIRVSLGPVKVAKITTSANTTTMN